MKFWLRWSKTITIPFKLHTCCLERGCHVNPEREISFISWVTCDLFIMTAWNRGWEGPRELPWVPGKCAPRSIFSDVCRGQSMGARYSPAQPQSARCIIASEGIKGTFWRARAWGCLRPTTSTQWLKGDSCELSSRANCHQLTQYSLDKFFCFLN